MRILPLPLLKKIKFDSLVLDNYQITKENSKAMGETIHYLEDNIKSICLSNNNMDDESIFYVIKGMAKNPIEKLIIHHNVVGKNSIGELRKVINNPKQKIKHLELSKCIHNSALISGFIKDLSKNREIEHLRLSSIDLSSDVISDLSDFVVNNFSLKDLNLSWSEISSDELLLLLTKIKG